MKLIEYLNSILLYTSTVLVISMKSYRIGITYIYVKYVYILSYCILRFYLVNDTFEVSYVSMSDIFSTYTLHFMKTTQLKHDFV